MKGLYITTRDMALTKTRENGIYQKICAQQNELRKNFDLTVLDGDWKNTVVKKILARFPFFPSSFPWRKKDVPEEMDFLYFRYDYGDRQTALFLKEFRKKNPKAKIIIEFSTYPFKWERFPFYVRMMKGKTERCSKKLTQIADYSITYGSHTSAYGIPTIPVENGIIFEELPKRKICGIPSANEVHVISVSSMNRVHRIDRMIMGLADYYQSDQARKIYLHLVGDGLERSRLEKLVLENSLEKYVIFHGYQVGSDLAAIYNRCTLAMETLADHKMESSSLKSREYLAKGLPFITSCEMNIKLSELRRYILSVPANDSPISMKDVLWFYDSVYCPSDDIEIFCKVSDEIRMFAKTSFEFSKSYVPVIEYLGK